MLNVRGIFKNHQNIVKDDKFGSVPLICLTETKTSRDSDLLPLQEYFHMHTSLVRNTNKYKSLRLLFNYNLFESADFHQYDTEITQ